MRSKWIPISAIVLILAGLAALKWGARPPWWHDDTLVTQELRVIAAQAFQPISQPAWRGYLEPNRASLLGQQGETIEVLFVGTRTGRLHHKVWYRQSTDPEFKPAHWEGALETETVTIHGVEAILQHGYSTTLSGTRYAAGADGRTETAPMSADRVARIWWEKDGITYLVEGHFVDAKQVQRIAASVRQLPHPGLPSLEEVAVMRLEAFPDTREWKARSQYGRGEVRRVLRWLSEAEHVVVTPYPWEELRGPSASLIFELRDGSQVVLKPVGDGARIHPGPEEVHLRSSQLADWVDRRLDPRRQAQRILIAVAVCLMVAGAYTSIRRFRQVHS